MGAGVCIKIARLWGFPVLQKFSDMFACPLSFVDAQLTMAARARGNGGYYRDSQVNLSRTDDVSAARFLAAPATRTRTYGAWSASRPARTGYQSLPRASSSDSAIPTTVKAYGILAHTASCAGCRSRAGGLAKVGSASSHLDDDISDPAWDLAVPAACQQVISELTCFCAELV